MRATFLIPPLFEPPIAWVANLGNVRLGVHLQGEWCVEIGGRTRVLSRPDDTMPLLPLLEMSRTEFYECLHRIAQTTVELVDVPTSFPSDLLLRFALDSSVSEYWPLMALDWIDAETTVGSQIRESLQSLLSKPWLTQRLKQRAEMVVKRNSRKKAPNDCGIDTRGGDPTS